MKKPTRWSLTGLLVLLWVVNSSAQTDSFCNQLELVKELISSTHFYPKPINDDLSESVYELVMQDLNSGGTKWTQPESSQLTSFIKSIDDSILNGTCDFIIPFTALYKDYIEKRILFLESLKTVSLDYSGTDKLHNRITSTKDYPEDETQKLQYWSQALRLNVLLSISRASDRLKDAQENFKKLEKNTKLRLIEEELCRLKELQVDENYRTRVEHSFLNALLHYHDPHSSFFTQDEKFSFETSVAADQESYGLQVKKNKDNEFQVARIVPGSPAFKNNDIELDDVIVSLTTQNGEESMTCKSARAINAFLSSPQHKSINIQLRKRNTTLINTQLRKALLAVEDNAVRAYLIGESEKAGYIRIPSFYTDLESPYGLGLANDVAKEIYKLKKENISSLILDLRNNGGGSMKEAIDLVGMFINRGPVTILNERNKDPFTSKDFNRGAAYTDPVIILVNGNSASASELFAATMQDYNRGLIVGSRTYGKSTLQTIEALSKDENLGFVKITSGGFHRISGLTHQGIGVQPDVLLPFLGDSIMDFESDENYYLDLGTLTPQLKYLKYPAANIPQLQSNSKKRINSNKKLQLIKASDSQLSALFENYVDGYSLDLESIFNFNKKVNELLTKASSPEKENALIISNTTSVNELLNYNAADKSLNEDLLENMSKDPYIKESYHILKDLLHQ